MSDNILHVNDADFDAEVLASAEPVLVDFWAEWCGPCKMIAPMVDTLAGEYAGRAKVVKLNIESNPATGRKYGIRGIPTLLLFKDGKVEGTQVGAPGNIKTLLTQMLDKAIA